MILLNPERYKLLGFEKSKYKDKKYDAILSDFKVYDLGEGNSGYKLKRIPFGTLNYAQYEDKALGLYSNLNHYDKKRKQLYKARHAKDINNLFSSGYFSNKYLW